MSKNFIYIICLFGAFLFSQNIQAQNQVFFDYLPNCSFNNNWSWEAEGMSQGEWSVVKLRNSIDESCALSFVDNLSKVGDTTIMSLRSKWLQAYDYEELNISFDLIFFKNDVQAHVFDFMIDYGNGPELIHSYTKHVYKGTVSEFEHQMFKIQVMPGTKLQLLFRYNSNGFKSAFIQMDNIKVTGPSMQNCNFAYEIKTLGKCIRSNNVGSEFSVDQPSCSSNNSSAIWYQYISEFTGIVKITTNAQFNDAITIYERTCEKEDEVGCSDRDEYGFAGDELYANIKKGKYYFIRVSGVQNEYSVTEGDFCFMMEQVDSMPPTPSNDWCENAQELFVDSLCVAGSNVNADLDGPLPSLNHRSKADIWYYFDFMNGSSQQIIISSNADFSDVITVYKGNCDQLEEVECSVEGGVALLSNLEDGQRYFIQVSSYFSTLEGNVCMDLYGFENKVAVNDSCFQSIDVEVDGECVEASNEGAKYEGIRASCVFNAESDIWFEFEAPKSGNIVVYPEAQFLYNIAIFQGNCDSLVEVFCESSNNQCEGFVNISSLIANEKHYIQISSAFQHSGVTVGDVCLQIYSKANAPTFIPLTAEVKEECIAGVLSRLKLDTQGGKGQLDIRGFDADALYEIGDHYIISVEDERGCRVFVEGDVACPDQSVCNNDSLSIVVNPSCELDPFGLNTGFVIFDYAVNNGSQNILNLGTQKGAKLAHGDTYKVYIIDLKDSCLNIKEGIIDCPPYDCSQSNLSLDISFDCIDTLWKARLGLSALGGHGNYSFSGAEEGDLFDNGDTVNVKVVDGKGCESILSVVVNCSFDSCAFSRITASVDIECLTNQFGNETGFAIVTIVHDGGVGAVDYQGVSTGDTLFFGDKYELVATDEWGCTSVISGKIECEPNTAVDDVSAIDGISVFPNPTNEFINLSWEHKFNESINVEFVSYNGKVIGGIIKLSMSQNMVSYDVSRLVPGVYFVRMNIGSDRSIKKFIKL